MHSFFLFFPTFLKPELRASVPGRTNQINSIRLFSAVAICKVGLPERATGDFKILEKGSRVILYLLPMTKPLVQRSVNRGSVSLKFLDMKPPNDIL